MARPTKATPQKKQLFLASLRSTGNITLACKKAVWDRTRAYDYKAEDPEFAQAWAEALESYTETLEREADRRAVAGVRDLVLHQGAPVTHKKKLLYRTTYSDTLLIFRLKALKPEKYRDNHTIDLGNKPGETLKIETLDDKTLEAIAASGVAKP